MVLVVPVCTGRTQDTNTKATKDLLGDSRPARGVSVAAQPATAGDDPAVLVPRNLRISLQHQVAAPPVALAPVAACCARPAPPPLPSPQAPLAQALPCGQPLNLISSLLSIPTLSSSPLPHTRLSSSPTLETTAPTPIPLRPARPHLPHPHDDPPCLASSRPEGLAPFCRSASSLVEFEMAAAAAHPLRPAPAHPAGDARYSRAVQLLRTVSVLVAALGKWSVPW